MNDEAVRDQMGAALCRVPRVWTGDFGPYEIADALLPVIREIAAELLREAADAAHDEYSGWEAADVVRARADALTKPPDGPVR